MHYQRFGLFQCQMSFFYFSVRLFLSSTVQSVILIHILLKSKVFSQSAACVCACALIKTSGVHTQPRLFKVAQTEPTLSQPISNSGTSCFPTSAPPLNLLPPHAATTPSSSYLNYSTLFSWSAIPVVGVVAMSVCNHEYEGWN